MKNLILSELIEKIFISTVLLILTSCCVGMAILALVTTNVPENINLNENPKILTVGDTWFVDNQFIIKLDSVTTLSSVVAEQEYELICADGMQYFEVVFSCQNINFIGYQQDDNIIEKNLCVSVLISGLDENRDTVFGWLESNAKPWYKYAKSSNEILTTPNMISEENKIIVKLEDTDEKVKYLNVFFKIPVNNTTFYGQNYLVAI